jgi:hypothetical protein
MLPLACFNKIGYLFIPASDISLQLTRHTADNIPCNSNGAGILAKVVLYVMTRRPDFDFAVPKHSAITKITSDVLVMDRNSPI